MKLQQNIRIIVSALFFLLASSLTHAKEPKFYVISPKISKELTDFYFNHGFKPRRSIPTNLSPQDKIIFYDCQISNELEHLQILYVCHQPNESDITTNAFLIPAPSPVDQLTLAQTVMAQDLNIAVFYSRNSELQYKYLATNKAEGVKLSGYRSYGSLKFDKDIKEIIKDNDAVLALTDNSIFNTATLRAIMLSTYREHKPIFGPDKAFVQAGSIASLYVTEINIAETAIELSNQFQNDEYLPGIYFTKTQQYETNPTAARTLSLDLPLRSEISSTVTRKEAKDVHL